MAHDTDLDAVLVQHRTHLVGGQINVTFPVIATDKTVAIAMALDHAFNFFEQAIGVSGIFDIESFFP
jgi:hypothetical protein